MPSTTETKRNKDGLAPAVALRLTASERGAKGRQVRITVPRSSHGEWVAPAHRKDPLAILVDQERTRVTELVPIRHGRMAASPFAFYRGAAAVMAPDLAGQPSTGLVVQLCGDAHLMNFGGFADPDRDLVFDVNDFDETHPGPFEWDVKRLSASLEVATRARGFDDRLRRRIVAAGASAYRLAIREFAAMRWIDIWYARLDMAGIQQRWGATAGAGAMRNFQRTAAKAETKDSLKAFGKLTQQVGDEIRFVSDPPLLQPVGELFSDVDASRLRKTIDGSFRAYRRTLPRNRRRLLERYVFVDLARKVVGVGSVGTRCWVVLLLGRDASDPLFLQVKEAEASVLEPYSTKSQFSNHGQRVVEGQLLMQAASDILLGWDRVVGADDNARDFYFRQLWDWKASANVDIMTPEIFSVYAEICGWTLARAHARSGDPVAIGSYLGSGTTFDDAMARFAVAYADQNEADYRAFTDAIAKGKIEAVTGV